MRLRIRTEPGKTPTGRTTIIENADTGERLLGVKSATIWIEEGRVDVDMSLTGVHVDVEGLTDVDCMRPLNGGVETVVTCVHR